MFSINSTTHYISGDDFISVNPWFTVTLDHRFGLYTSSSRFENRVIDIQKENFSRLLDRYSNPLFQQMLDNHKTKLSLAADAEVARIARAANVKVDELVNNADNFSELRANIQAAAVERTNKFLEREELEHSRRLVALEKSMEETQNKQWFTFFGGAFVGAAIVALNCRK